MSIKTIDGWRSGRPRQRPGRAFTLIELLVVISIVGLLMAILLPALQSARESAGRVKCLAQLRQVQFAVLAYADSERDKLPALRYRGVSLSTGNEIDYHWPRPIAYVGFIPAASYWCDQRPMTAARPYVIRAIPEGIEAGTNWA